MISRILSMFGKKRQTSQVCEGNVYSYRIICTLLHHFISGGHKKMSELDPRVICPFFDVFMPFLPESFRRKMRCGVRHGDVSMAVNVVNVLAVF